MLLGPLVIVGGILADNIAVLAETVRSWLQEGPPQPPTFLTDLPIVGPRLAAYWRELAEGGAKLAETVRTTIGPVTRWLLAIVGPSEKGLPN